MALGWPAILILFSTLNNVIVFVLIARVGLVVPITGWVVGTLLQSFPLTLDGSAWYLRVGFVGIALVAALAIAAFRVATAPHLAESRVAARAST